jgi:hypothetical protein
MYFLLYIRKGLASDVKIDFGIPCLDKSFQQPKTSKTYSEYNMHLNKTCSDFSRMHIKHII